MTVLSIVQAVSEELGLPTITGVTDSTDANVKQILRHLNNEGKFLTRQYDWSRLTEEHTFSTADGTASYALPDDFLRMLPVTHWNRSDNWQVLGPTSPQEWQFRKSGLVTTSVRDRFRVKGNDANRFFLEPTPSSVETIAFEYISGNWALDDDGSTRKATVTKNGDTVLLDEYLLQLGATWRYLKSKGFPYAEEHAEYERVRNSLIGNDGGGPSVLHMDGGPFARSQMPDTIPQ